MRNKINLKHILLSVIVIASLCFTSYIVALSIQSGIDYIVELIILEQNDHYNKMRRNIADLDYALNVFQKNIYNLQKKQLAEDEKKIIRKQLRDLEEIGLNISRETSFYQEDNTVHFFFEPKEYIFKYFNNTRNTPLFINRFVRVMEQGLFVKNITKEQKNMIMENYNLLLKEINSI